MRIALVSEHASPLAVAGGVDAGGQNIYVANIAKEFARMGHAVDVFTRRDCASLLTRTARQGRRHLVAFAVCSFLTVASMSCAILRCSSSVGSVDDAKVRTSGSFADFACFLKSLTSFL